MWLFEGTELTADGEKITADAGSLEGNLKASLRVADGDPVDGFVTNADLPADDILRGVWMFVVHPEGYTQACEIVSVTRQDGRTVVQVANDHGLVVDGDGTREVYFPARTFAGPTQCRIPLATVLPGSA